MHDVIRGHTHGSDLHRPTPIPGRQTAYDDGYQTALRGGDWRDNPFRPSERDWSEFNRGVDDAVREMR